jgi:DNA polymerase-3 subunit gamma/tau
MAHTVLARKWRPKTFAQMVGQAHILKVIENSLELKRLHHAYLFCGTRGVGKTTLARLFAKCLNCETGITSTPCNQCSACQQIDTGCFVDLIEIDAASRTKVEDTRDLLDNVQYAPTSGRYKVYLIDEVHMLSTHSFNALLKTLEEPPEHIVFLLATTDPQKLPITVLSRCLKLQLQSLPEEQIATHLRAVLEAEKIEAEPEALLHIASAAKGSVRDALSLLDQAIVYSNGTIESHATANMLGLVSQEPIWELITALSKQDILQMLDIINTMQLNDEDFIQVAEALQTAFYHLTLFQQAPEAIATRRSDYDKITEFASHFEAQALQLYYQILAVGKADIALAPTPQIGFEMLLMRLAAFSPHSQMQALAPAKQATTVEKSAHITKKPIKTMDNLNWHELVNHLNISGMTKIIAEHANIGNSHDDRLELCIQDEQRSLCNERQIQLLTSALSEYFGKPITLTITSTQQKTQETPIERRKKEQSVQKQQARSSIDSDNNIKELVDVFSASIDTDSIETNQ